jgi:alpha-L-fucosidase 2
MTIPYKTITTHEHISSTLARGIYAVMLVLCLCASHGVAAASLSIWFDQPASDWEKEGLPIGNGAMGAVIAGGVQRDLIQFNEKTLWTGGPGAEGYDFGWPEQPQTAALNQSGKPSRLMTL